jgi:hypothetical protein
MSLLHPGQYVVKPANVGAFGHDPNISFLEIQQGTWVVKESEQYAMIPWQN